MAIKHEFADVAIDSFLNTIVLFCGFFVAGSLISSYKKEDIKAKQLMGMPDSYWEAKKEEAIASVKRYELDVQSRERLELDKRERKAREAAAQREFEKTAPPEYWISLAKQKEAEEQGKTERQIASARASAIENAARQLSYSL